MSESYKNRDAENESFKRVIPPNPRHFLPLLFLGPPCLLIFHFLLRKKQKNVVQSFK